MGDAGTGTEEKRSEAASEEVGRPEVGQDTHWSLYDGPQG